MRWPRSTWAFCTCQLRHPLDLVAFREGGAVKQPISAPGQKMSWYPPFSPSSSTGTRNLCTEFSFQSWLKNHMWWNRGRWNPLGFPLQLNTAGKQAFRENQSIHHCFYTVDCRSELRRRYLRLLLAVLLLLILIIIGPHVARGTSLSINPPEETEVAKEDTRWKNQSEHITGKANRGIAFAFAFATPFSVMHTSYTSVQDERILIYSLIQKRANSQLISSCYDKCSNLGSSSCIHSLKFQLLFCLTKRLV